MNVYLFFLSCDSCHGGVWLLALHLSPPHLSLSSLCATWSSMKNEEKQRDPERIGENKPVNWKNRMLFIIYLTQQQLLAAAVVGGVLLSTCHHTT